MIERLLGEKVNPLEREVFKFSPTSPPRRHEIVVVDGTRSRVTHCRVRWDGPRWTIRSLRVKRTPQRR